MLDRMSQRCILAAMWVVTLQTTILTGKYPLVGWLQRCGAQIMAIDTERTTCRFEQVFPVGYMCSMTDITLSLLGRSVSCTLLPIAVDLVTTETEGGLFL